MVKRERPTLVLVLARSGVLLGLLGLVGAGAVAAACVVFEGPASSGLVVPLNPAGAEQLRFVLPGFRAFEMLVPIAGLVLASLVLAAGIGLLSGRRIARTAALTAAGAVLVTEFVILLYELTVVLPGIDHWNKGDFPRKAPDVAPPFGDLKMYWVALLLLIGGLIFFLHAVVTLVVLNAPAVADTFRREPGSEDCPKGSPLPGVPGRGAFRIDSED
jgi:hypothetical protein